MFWLLTVVIPNITLRIWQYIVVLGDVDSIRKGVIEVMEKEYNPDLKNHVISNFTWEHTAQQTLEGYKLALQLHNK